MKIFIVFLGLMLINTSIISYKTDYGRYVYLLKALDNIALECAEIAAQDPDEARVLANEMLEYTVNNLKNIKIRNYSYEVALNDSHAAVFVRIDVEKLFRFPYSPVTSIIAERKSLAYATEMI